MKTKSEGLFEGFLATNNLPFEKIKEDTTPRPDYCVFVGGSEIIFELKELSSPGLTWRPVSNTLLASNVGAALYASMPSSKA
jgi:hypothetical protein